MSQSNTLNTISALIQEDPERAERTVEQLAVLLHFSLDTRGALLGSLGPDRGSMLVGR